MKSRVVKKNKEERIGAVIFDLDGTLLDTIDDIADSMNAVLEEMSLPTHETEKYKYLVGDGVGALAERVLPEACHNEQTVAEYVRRMNEEYSNRWADKTRPYEGIPDLLDALSQRGLSMSVLSNKLDEFTKMAVERFLGDWAFSCVIGAGSDLPRKPDPAGALFISDKVEIPPREFLYVGDTNTDMKTAVAAGMFPVGVLWGFRDRQELIDNGAGAVIEQPLDLLDLIP